MCFYWSTLHPTLLSSLATHLTLTNENENTELELGRKNEVNLFTFSSGFK